MEMTLMTSDGETLERKAWSRVFSDGLWDLYLGAVLANAAVWTAASEFGTGDGITPVVPIGFLIVFLGVFRQAKAKITEPRVGYFKIAQSRTRKVTTAGYLAVAATFALVAATFIAGMTGVPEGVPFVAILFFLFAAQATLLLWLAGYKFGMKRFYLYAALAATGFIVSEILVATQGITRGWDIVGVVGLPAIPMLPTGVVLLTRFLRDHPLPEDGSDA